MYISNETVEQTEKRLKKVIQTADFRIFDKSYYFKEVPVTNFKFEREALAIVRDQDVWSFLIPSVSTESENFKIFSFHFENGLDHSGFVGWLTAATTNVLYSFISSDDISITPGNKFQYNVSSYLLLACILERVTGQSFE